MLASSTWDAENRLASFHQKGVSGGNAFDQRITHTYNGDNLRVRRQSTGLVDNTDVSYVWDGQNIHLKGSTESYLWEPRQYGNLICTGAPEFHLYDALGSTMELTSSGFPNIDDTYKYSAWGEVSNNDKQGTAKIDPFLFVGRLGYYTDDEGLDTSTTSPLLPIYLHERFYHPVWGRLLNQDPLRLRTEWLNAMFSGPATDWLAVIQNPYRYVGNNPVNFTDPSGLFHSIADCKKDFAYCVQHAYDSLQACKKKYQNSTFWINIICVPKYNFNLDVCKLDLAFCVATSNEALKLELCVGAVAAAIACAPVEIVVGGVAVVVVVCTKTN